MIIRKKNGYDLTVTMTRYELADIAEYMYIAEQDLRGGGYETYADEVGEKADFIMDELWNIYGEE